MKQRNSFTLAELCLVVAVIALLGTLFTSVAARLRVDAKAALCLNNKSHAIAAQNAYAADYNGYYIIERMPKGGDLNSNSWVALLCNGVNPKSGNYTVQDGGKYLKFADAQCPESTPYLGAGPRAYHVQVYGINYQIGNPRPLLGEWFVKDGDFKGINPANMKKPDVLPIFADTVRCDGVFEGTGTPYWCFTIVGLTQNRSSKIPTGGFYEAHAGKSAVAFADGHVEFVSGQEMFDSPFVLKTWMTGKTADTMVST